MNRRLTGLLSGVLAIALVASCSNDVSTASPNAVGGETGGIAAATAGPTSATTGSATGRTSLVSTDVEREPAPENVATISLDDGRTTSDDPSVRVDGSVVTITGGGAYSLRGRLTAGRVIVDSDDDEPVWLILEGVDITNPTGAAIAVIDASAAFVVLADGSENRLADGAAYTFDDPAEEEPNATLFSKADLTIDGPGSLTVSAAYNDGIAGKDALVILAGNLTVNAADDGIRGRDSLAIEGGTIVISARGDGLTSDNDEDAALGWISIAAGTLDITSAGDAIQAETDVHVAGGEFRLSAGGGSRARLAADASAKGIKGGVRAVVDGGAFEIDAADDAIHATGGVTISGGVFALATGDDAIHADATVELNGGSIDITASYEGVESASVTINDGDIRLVSSDDGISVAGGTGAGQQRPPTGGAPPAGGAAPRGAFPGGAGSAAAGEIPVGGGMPGGGAAASADNRLTINGGRILIEAAGDGIDANGSIVMTGGTVVVHGPTVAGNAALDYDRSFQLSGGTLVAVGSSRMAQRPGTGSAQASIGGRLGAARQGGTLLQVRSGDGSVLLSFQPSKAYESLVFSSAELVSGQTYEVYADGARIASVTAS
jgi:hypothetical protein